MADPLTLTVLGGVAAAEGIKFLYGQAAEVIKAWRARRDETRNEIEAPFVETTVLDATPVKTTVDAAVVAEHQNAMIELWTRLAPYAQGLQDVDVADEGLARTAGELRALLEAAYRQRLTFRGEQRESTGTAVTVAQVLGTVAGRVVGVEGDVAGGGSVAVRQDAGEVTETGTVIGIKGRISG